jgi:hypothetical protein
MFNKDNIISVRYTNPENDSIEVIYTEEDGRNIPFFLAAKPTTVPAWKILKEAGWTPSKIADSTVEWIRDQTILQYQVAESFAKVLAEERVETAARDYDEQVQNIRNQFEKDKQDIEKRFDDDREQISSSFDKAKQEISERYDARVMDISSSMNQETTVSSLYSLINDLNENEEVVFKLKLDILEDAGNFEDMNKTDEKTKRREIRKCKTLKDLMRFV